MFKRSANQKKRNWNSKKFTESRLLFVPQTPIQKGKKQKDIMIGFLWSIEQKGDINALPSINEIFYGLYQFIANYLKEKLEATH